MSSNISPGRVGRIFRRSGNVLLEISLRLGEISGLEKAAPRRARFDKTHNVEKYFTLMGAIIPIYAIIASGWGMRKLGWMKPEGDASIMRIAIDFTLPCFIIYNLLGNERLRDIEYSLGAILIGAVGMGLSLLICWQVARAISLKVGEGKRTFTVATAAHNYGFFMIALIAIYYGGQSGEMIGLLITHNIGCDIVYWSVGFLIISNTGKFSLKTFLRGPFIAVFVSLGLVWTGMDKYVPEMVMTFTKIMGQCAIPLNLMLFGTMIYDWLSWEEMPNFKVIGIATALRMAALPALYIIFALILPIDPSLKWLIMFQAVAPCGVTSAILARHFGGHPRMAVQITVATMAVSVFTIPLVLEYALPLLGK